MVQDQIHLAHAIAHIHGQVLHRQISGLVAAEEILAFGREAELESAGGIRGGLPLDAGLIADRDLDSGNARIVFIDGAAGHHDLGVQRNGAEESPHRQVETFHRQSSSIALFRRRQCRMRLPAKALQVFIITLPVLAVAGNIETGVAGGFRFLSGCGDPQRERFRAGRFRAAW